MAPQRGWYLSVDADRYLTIWWDSYEAEAITALLQEVEMKSSGLTRLIEKYSYETFHARVTV